MARFSECSVFGVFLAILLACQADKSKVEQYLNRCIDSANHKKTPGPEFQGVKCGPWGNHSCCTTDTSAQIQTDGTLSLYSMVLDQCPTLKKMSKKCRQHFHRDTCFYECSPNFAPWIVKDPTSKKVRRERVNHIPLCASDCDQWFHDCIDDYTCNDNWGKNWNWAKKGSSDMCIKPCKTFKEYFKDPVTFCETIFNFSFKYTDEAEGCMTMWPDTVAKQMQNRKVAEQNARKRLSDGNSGTRLILSWVFYFVVIVSTTNIISIVAV